MFEPINQKHGIFSATIVIILAKPLKDLVPVKESLLDKQNVLKYAGKSEMVTIQHSSSGEGSTRSIENGFVLKDDDVKPSRTLHAFNDPIRTALVYTDLRYDRWAPFFKNFKEVSTALASVLEANEIVAAALEYVDKFRWKKPEGRAFSWKGLLNPKATMLPPDFHDHNHLQFHVSRNRRVEDFEAKEHLSVTRENENTISIMHHVSKNFESPHDVSDMNKVVFYDELEKLHKFNKAVLRELLTGEMAKRVGVSKN